jgi:iron complex outermembrane receptor protein
MDRSTLTRRSAVALAVSATLAAYAGVASAQQSESAAAEELEQVVVTGTRVQNRSVLETVAPVDVVNADSLMNVGTTELNQALSVALPSFNFPRPGLSDGTDSVRPATLRGLGPDQTLVLVNSKRRHSAALVNVNNTVGRGSAAVDLNTIPNAMIRSIEILRDGASAQYGSDAIAGVINLRLREDRDGGGAMVTYGARVTEYDVPIAPLTGLTGAPIADAPPAGAPWMPTGVTSLKRSVTDGRTVTASLWKGFALGADGHVTVAAEYKDQDRTERSGWDWRQQYARPTPTTFDPRETTINRWNGWSGDPDLDQKTLFVNAGLPLAGGARLYGWASYQNRETVSAGFYRRSLDTRNITSIYPDGFLPQIAPQIDDYSAAAGVEWKLGAWDMDTSLVYGKNKMEFTIQNTLNRSIGPTSKTQFDAGGFAYDQFTLNVSGVRTFDVSWASSPLNVATGIEARREGYSINAGEPDSYRNGGALFALGAAGCTAPTAADVTRGGCLTPAGAQVFPGFRPQNATDQNRRAIGAYVDLEANITDKLLTSVAVRAEDYSDFGSSVAGKLAARYDFTPSFALRGTVQNGFRAPSLQQQYFTTTSTNFIGGVPFEVTTFPVADPVARALGAKDLDAEKSLNFSVGAVFRFDRATLTIDAYRIDVTDRIVLSENLGTGTGAVDVAIRNYLAAQGLAGNAGRFFINGVDTKTQGVDAVLSVPLTAGAAGEFDVTLAGNYTKTTIEKVPTTAQLSSLPVATPPDLLFQRFQRKIFEDGQPDNKFSINVNWKLDGFGATLRATRYGKVLAPDNNPANDTVIDPAILIDLEARATFGGVGVALGAENLLDEYPDAFAPRLNTTINVPSSNLSAFGRSGRLVYGRLTYTF